MNHQNLILKIGAVVPALFGLALVLAPNELAAAYKAAELNPTGIYNSMLYGATLLGVAVMNWAASDARPDQARYVILGNFVSSVLAAIVAVIRQIGSASAQPTGWINIAIFVVFAVLFGYLYFARSERQGTGGAAHANR